MAERTEPEFGIMMASVNGSGTWGALRDLRAGLRKLGSRASTTILFLDAMDADGKVVPPHDARAVALVIGYSVSRG